MKLTILGNYGPYPKKGGTCSGYLLEDQDTKILLDCGNGVFSNLQKVCNIEALNAIILTHLHPDHISDIFILRYALQFKNLSLPIFAPNNPQEEFERLYYKTFHVDSIREDRTLKIGSIKLNFKKMDHVIPNYAVLAESNGKKFVYSGDTKFTTDLIDFSKKANILLCEAGVLEKDLCNKPPHLSAKQAVEISQKALVSKLILTHFYPEYSIDMYKEEVQQYHHGNIDYAEEMKSYFI